MENEWKDVLPDKKGEYDVWVSCDRFTCWVKVKREWWSHPGDFYDTVVDGAPIVKRWVRQDFWKFLRYYKFEQVKLL